MNGFVHPGCRTKYTPDGVSSALLFRSPTKELIHELKYRGITDIVSLCVTLLSPSIPQSVTASKPIIVPVPLYKTRLRERGFNQSALLAKGIAKTLGLQCFPEVLERIRPTTSQTKLTREERRENVAHAFICRYELAGRPVILIDDTVTTGSTLVSCTKALRRAGAGFVWAATLAQAPLTSQIATERVIMATPSL